MGTNPQPVVSQDKEAGVWVVRLEGEGGKVQEFRCSSEQQARGLVLLMSARENQLPR